MECPHGWDNCQDCYNWKYCKPGVYIVPVKEEEQREAVRQAAVVAEKIVHEEAVRSANIISTPKELMQAGSREFWKFWGATSPPDPENRTREPIAAMSGPVKKGGGNKSGKKPKPVPHVKQFQTWENL